jgi:hypothetical protein
MHKITKIPKILFIFVFISLVGCISFQHKTSIQKNDCKITIEKCVKIRPMRSLPKNINTKTTHKDI